MQSSDPSNHVCAVEVQAMGGRVKGDRWRFTPKDAKEHEGKKIAMALHCQDRSDFPCPNNCVLFRGVRMRVACHSQPQLIPFNAHIKTIKQIETHPTSLDHT